VAEASGRTDLRRHDRGRHRRDCRRPLSVPPILTQSVLVLLGISLGSLVSRQLLQHLGAYP